MALAEYDKIKDEQTARIGWRDNLLYVTLVAVGTLLAFAHSGAYLLLVPAATAILGWNYLANDVMISAIGRYFRDHPVLHMAWESDHAGDTRRKQRKAIQLAVDIATFCGPAAIALIAFWVTPGQPPLLIAGSVIEALATAGLAWQFTIHATGALAAGTPVLRFTTYTAIVPGTDAGGSDTETGDST
jgi:hypothetical protein